MICRVLGAMLMMLFVFAYIFAMVYANYVFGYDTALLVFVESMCAFGFLFALEMFIHDD